MKATDKVLAVLRAIKNISDPTNNMRNADTDIVYDLVTIAIEEMGVVYDQLSNADVRMAELNAELGGTKWRMETLEAENAELQKENARLQNELPQVEMRFNSKLTKKIAVIKAFRENLGWGLKHTKDFVELLNWNDHEFALLRDFGDQPTRMGLESMEKLVDDINRADPEVNCEVRIVCRQAAGGQLFHRLVWYNG